MNGRPVSAALLRAALRAVVIGAAAAASPAAAQCRLALSLGLDVSSSVDAREYRLQTLGLAAALTAPEVRDAFLADPAAPVMLQVFEWSGWQQQIVRQDWVRIETPADLDAVAVRLGQQARSFEQYPTALGLALLFGARSLSGRGECDRRTLDLSGDGTNNDGMAPDVARREFAMGDIVVNGLVVGSNVATLGRYYQQFVIQGEGAFVEVAGDYSDFERAMKRKLLRELGVMEMSEDRGVRPPQP